MSTISPSKALLSFQDYTPAKIIVQSDLNGWLETNKKQNISYSPLKRGVRKHPPKQYFMPQTNNVQSLKIKRQILLKLSDTKKKSLSIPSTHAGSAESSNFKNTPQTLAFKQQCNNLPLLKISEFSPTQPSSDFLNNRKSIEFQRPLLRLRQMHQPQKITFQIKKMQQKNRRMTKILSFNRIKNQKQNINSLKKQMINKSVQVNNGKLSANQKLALNMIARKTQNIQIRYLKTKKMDCSTIKF